MTISDTMALDAWQMIRCPITLNIGAKRFATVHFLGKGVKEDLNNGLPSVVCIERK